MAKNAGKRRATKVAAFSTMRENPLPLAMIGLGAGWLLMKSRRRERERVDYVRATDERVPIGYEAGSTKGARIE